MPLYPSDRKNMNLRTFIKPADRFYRFCFLAVLLVGIYLRCYQFLMGRSLWEDEAHLALNIISRGYSDLLKPLDYIQAAPPLFLWTTKTLALLFGYGPIGLRMLPFLASLATLPLFYFLLLALCRMQWVALMGFFAFGVNLSVIYYSSELKTYALDVSVFILLVYLAVASNHRVAKRRHTLLAIAGSLSILYSNIAFIILFSIALCMAIRWLSEKRIPKTEVRTLLCWALVFVGYYFAFVYHHPHEQIQRSNYHFGFPPLPFFSAAFHKFISTTFEEVFFSQLLIISRDMWFGYVFFTLLLTGLITAVYKRRYEILTYCLVPILFHFTLSVLHIYPFWNRLILYFVPGLLLLASYGASFLLGLLAPVITQSGIFIMTIVLTVMLSKESLRLFPLWFREIAPAISYINSNYGQTPLFITTPYTLYKYYFTIGKAKNEQYEGIPWDIDTARYFQAVSSADRNYILLHAADTAVDGYGRVLTVLRERGKIVKQFRYKTYVVSELKPNNPDPAVTVITSRQFKAENIYDYNGEQVVAIWTGSVESKLLRLRQGQYHYTISSRGTALAGVFPQVSVAFGGLKLEDTFFTAENYSAHNGLLKVEKDTMIRISIALLNDANNAQTREDRNAFIHYIRLKKN
jgi:hypothetical protein